jgi:hypothetical protein
VQKKRIVNAQKIIMETEKIKKKQILVMQMQNQPNPLKIIFMCEPGEVKLLIAIASLKGYFHLPKLNFIIFLSSVVHFFFSCNMHSPGLLICNLSDC